jgi:hypothetical protein
LLIYLEIYIDKVLELCILDSGGDIEIIVASDTNSKIAPVREAFQNVFGNATVK